MEFCSWYQPMYNIDIGNLYVVSYLVREFSIREGSSCQGLLARDPVSFLNHTQLSVTEQVSSKMWWQSAQCCCMDLWRYSAWHVRQALQAAAAVMAKCSRESYVMPQKRCPGNRILWCCKNFRWVLVWQRLHHVVTRLMQKKNVF